VVPGRGEVVRMIVRTLEHWRELPHLRIAECAELAGVCERTIEAELPKMQTRTIGRIRFVTTDSFRRWIGETVEGQAKGRELDMQAERFADRMMRGMG